MRPKITQQINGKLELSHFSLTQAVDLESIDFYCFPHNKKPAQVFVFMKDITTGLTEIVELKETVSDYGKPVLRVPLTYSLRIKDAKVEIKIFTLDTESGTGTYSLPEIIYVSTANYKLARETAMVRELSDSVVNYYEAIVKVLQEVIEKGDNAE